MANVQRERLSVDVKGMKATLLLRAREDHISPSIFVRRALQAVLGSVSSSEASVLGADSGTRRRGSVRLSLRLRAADAHLIRQAARRAGMSLGPYLVGLARAVPVLAGGGARAELLSALHASATEMAALSRGLRHLTALLDRGQVESARGYWEMLLEVEDSVRALLRVVSDALVEAGLVAQPRRPRAARGSVRIQMRERP